MSCDDRTVDYTEIRYENGSSGASLSYVESGCQEDSAIIILRVVEAL
jgi:hypothetical protein